MFFLNLSFFHALVLSARHMSQCVCKCQPEAYHDPSAPCHCNTCYTETCVLTLHFLTPDTLNCTVSLHADSSLSLTLSLSPTTARTDARLDRSPAWLRLSPPQSGTSERAPTNTPPELHHCSRTERSRKRTHTQAHMQTLTHTDTTQGKLSHTHRHHARQTARVRAQTLEQPKTSTHRAEGQANSAAKTLHEKGRTHATQPTHEAN